MSKFRRVFTSYCKFFTYGFVSAASLFTWVELMASNHWITGIIIFIAVFAVIIPHEEEE